MNKMIGIKSRTVLLVCLVCMFSSFGAFAFPGPERGHDRGRPVKYYYRGAHWSRPGWFGFHFTVSAPPIGAFVEVLPAGHTTILISKRRYFYYENVYYQPYETGYVVIEPPAENVTVVNTVQPINAENLTINIPNSNGSFTPVTLVKQNGGYVGPQGEYYPSHPTIEQLKVLYGN